MSTLRLGVAVIAAFATMTSLSAAADDIQPPKMYTRTPTGVNLADGSYVETNVDLAIGPLQLKRSHLGGPVVPYSKAFGPSWTHNFEMYIRTVPSGPPINTFYSDVHIDEGVFTFSGDSAHNSATPWNDDARGNKLVKVGSVLRFTSRSGSVYEFVSATNLYHISKITYPSGRVLDFFYDSSEKLKEVRDSSGYAIVFDYNSSGYVADACAVNMVITAVSPASTCSGFSSPKQMVTYGYSSSPVLLTSVIDRLTQTTTYQYNAPDATKPAISCITPPGYSSCKISNTYGSAIYFYQVTQQTLSTGEVWNYSYTGSYAGKRVREADGANLTSTKITDPNGKVSTYGFVDSSPSGATDPYGNTTSHVFVGNEWKPGPSGQSSGTYWASTTLPEGNKFYATFDSRMNVTGTVAVDKAGTGSLTTSSSLPATGSDGLCGSIDPRICNQPIWKRDPKGNQTDFTYDSGSGALATEMGPAPTTGSARPLKVVTYTSYSASIRNTSGSLIVGPSMWLPASVTYCQTAAASPNTPACDSSAPQLTTTFEYGGAGTLYQLLIKGQAVTDGSTIRRTCYTYDWQGLKISTTSPRGTTSLSACP